MEKKKILEKPEITVIKFDSKDVITESSLYSTTRSYDIQSIKDFFNINVD